MNIKIDTTLERDIDLLILEEFISNPEFASIFLKAVGISDAYTIETAIHSKMDAELGESDIVFVLNINGKRHALHIEDKIDAIAMQNQSGRYHDRAKKDIAQGEYDEYSENVLFNQILKSLRPKSILKLIKKHINILIMLNMSNCKIIFQPRLIFAQNIN